MKKSIFLYLILLISFSVHCSQNKKCFSSRSRSLKKHEQRVLQVQKQSSIISIDDQKNTNEAFSHLKRRYPRKYNLKHNLVPLEQDDFGYAPRYSKQKKYSAI